MEIDGLKAASIKMMARAIEIGQEATANSQEAIGRRRGHRHVLWPEYSVSIKPDKSVGNYRRLHTRYCASLLLVTTKRNYIAHQHLHHGASAS